MGLFTKKDADGLPAKFGDLLKEARSGKADKDPVYKRRVLEKLKAKGVELWKAGKLKGCKNEYDLGDITMFLPQIEALQNCYASGIGGPVDEKASFECLLLRKDLCEDFTKRRELGLNEVNNIPYLWKYVGFCYLGGSAGAPRDNQLGAKYIMMAFQAWNEKNDQYGVSGAGIIRELMSGYPVPMLELSTFTMMAASLRSRGADYGAYVMQEIESMAQMTGEVSYKRLGSSKEVDVAIYLKAAAMGNAYATYRLARCYMYGVVVPKDEKKAIAYLEKAAESLEVAAGELFNYYAWKDSKSMTQEDRWAQERASKQHTKMEREALAKYTVDYIKNFKAPEAVAPVKENSVEHKGKFFTDSESPFTILDLPDVITGPYNVTYRKQSVSAYSADYLSDHGENATIHVSDIAPTGRSAQNSYGYFHW